MNQPRGYRYYRSGDRVTRTTGRELAEFAALGRLRLDPNLSDPSYLVHRTRTRLIRDWLARLDGTALEVLGVGSRIQVYRSLLEGRLRRYVSLDPQAAGVVDVIGVGEQLPFRDAMFDLVLCTQVLSYVTDPWAVSAEAHRVLRPGGVLILSAPAFFPRHHDERWRFLPDGLRLLLEPFGEVEITPEVHSIAGLFRTVNVCLDASVRGPLLRWATGRTLIPLCNLAGRLLDGLSRGNDQLTANYSVFARK